MRKKILAIVLCVAMVAIAVVGGTMAYFSDDRAQTNTFTAGKLTITLDECVVADAPNADGDLVATNERTEENQEYKLFPGMSVDKDPTITLDAGSENAYIAAKVVVTADVVDNMGLYDLAGVPNYDNLDIHALVSGGLVDGTGEFTTWNNLFVNETDECYIHQVADKANNTWTFYIFMKDAFTAGESVALFEKLNVNPAYNNPEMAVLNPLEIAVSGYGVQTVGFADCYDAMVGAFGQNAGDPFYFD